MRTDARMPPPLSIPFSNLARTATVVLLCVALPAGCSGPASDAKNGQDAKPSSVASTLEKPDETIQSPKAVPEAIADSPIHSGEDAAEKAWPQTEIAQRDFRVKALFADQRSKPWKLWMISTAIKGEPLEAMEFFTAERVSNVRVEKGAAESYSFTDAKGHSYSSVRTDPSRVDTEQPSIYADWERDGLGHDVVLGGYLFENKGSTSPDGVYSTKPLPTDSKRFFGGQHTCEPVVYVARTQGSQSRDSEDGFEPRTEVIADYDAVKRCWSTRPLHALDLQDNTFLLVIGTRVVRLNSKDLTPAGSAPSIRIIDIKED